MDGWIMFGIMVFVIIAQGALWAWVLIEKRNKIPDVPIMNWRELVEISRRGIEDYYRQLRTKRR
ncbi:MAG: hypothetical protein HGA45_34270 [Chloroflexales bacterium]|nr:hypothetical protein [Chloroflexales bacterium]